MCGIFGYLGPDDVVKKVIEGIKKLEYRGYDSAGLALICEDKLVTLKNSGKVAALEETVRGVEYPSFVGLSHTRWATHGVPSDANAHPQFDAEMKLALVHNGIIENHDSIRKMLVKKGVSFRSETDTEVIAQLIGYLYKGDFLKAVKRAIPLLKGAFAIAAIHENHKDVIIAAAKDSPLAIGLGEGENYLASDPQAFIKYTRRVIYLHESEIAVLKKDSFEVFEKSKARIEKEWEDLDIDIEEVSKGEYPHYMLKEIHEQPQTALSAMLSRYADDYGTALFEELTLSEKELQDVKRIVIIGCGTSWHAGLVGGYMLEEQARIPTQVEISSEFRYKNPIVGDQTLAIAISQSGETADTLAAIHELQRKGAKVIGICNVQGSTIAREVEQALFLRAGPEIGVASTKAFTSQLIVLSLLTLHLARMRGMSQQEGKRLLKALKQLPAQLRTILAQSPKIRELAKKYAHFDDFFYIGRRFMYPTALEGALKLKEIAYVNANGYPAGEMKHGPIALINESCATVAFTCDSGTYPKILSNMMEIKARKGEILAIAQEGASGIEEITNDVIYIPQTEDAYAPVLSTAVAQLLAYFLADERGTEIDQPRNLAKSVTVE